MKHLIFNSSVNNLSKMPIFKFDHIYQNQGRSFGPLLGLFLVNLLARAVAAKYYSNFPFHLPYDSNSWLAYNKPQASYNQLNYLNQWHPIKNPYSNYENYPTLTTASPTLSDQQFVDYHPDYANYDYSSNYPNDENLLPAESTNIQKKIRPENLTTTTTTTTQEPQPAESSYKFRRQPTQKYQRRPEPSRQKYPQRRRRPTPAPEYYDSYEDYHDRYPANKRRRPQFQSNEYYDEDYYGSVETTTRYRKKHRRRPTRKPDKNEDSAEVIDTTTETTTERFIPNTEIVIVRQAQTSTTTTEPSTTITNSTNQPTTAANNNTYGYGPSNGNEYVSFTYAPISKYQYQVPYVDWYTQEATRNAIVKRVRDIVNKQN